MQNIQARKGPVRNINACNKNKITDLVGHKVTLNSLPQFLILTNYVINARTIICRGHYKWEIYFMIEKVKKNMTPNLVYLGRNSVNVTCNVRKVEVFKNEVPLLILGFVILLGFPGVVISYGTWRLSCLQGHFLRFA